MTTHVEHDTEGRAQARVARKYKTLGYDVTENPRPELLPDFMYGIAPDIVARSTSDNVVIEVKRSSSLKGSNDLISIAERVSQHPGWRFELVAVENNEQLQIAEDDAFHELVLNRVHAANSDEVFGFSYLYLCGVLEDVAQRLAERNGVSFKNKCNCPGWLHKILVD